ncbi:MAG: polyprenyl synthetase family protein [Vicinamibacteria bacterium]
MQVPEPSRPAWPPIGLDDIIAEVQEELTQVDKFIEEKINSNVELIQESSRYVYQSGGKRIRPALLLLAGKLCGYRGSKAHYYAAVMEFIHTATLIHDDIIDEATLRRGKTSVNSLLGNDVTVLLGDYLYIRSMGLAIELGNLEILQVISDVTLRMIEGMILELNRGGDLKITEEEHLEILRLKTAYLFSGCSRIGALLAESGGEQQRILADYGLNLGMAFQVVDDMLDFMADEKVLGKPVLSDLKEGHVTLPILYALQAEPRATPTVQAVIDRKAVDDVSGKEILELVRRHRALDKARSVAESYSSQAKQTLAPLPDSALKDSLIALADYVIERNL